MYLFYGILFFCSSLVLGQSPVTEFCDIDQFPVDPRNLSIPKIVSKDGLAFTANYEANEMGFTQQITEIFDGKNNLAIAYQTVVGNTVKTYSDYSKDELLEIFNFRQPEMKCVVHSLKEDYKITPFDLVRINGKDVPVSPLSQLFHRDGYTEFKYTGNSNFIRGIPVNEWKTCIYETNVTNKITFSFSDKDRWTPANYDIQYQSIPVQIRYEILNNQNLKVEQKIYSYFDFKPYVIETDQHTALPEGIYCPNKVSTKPTPILSSHFSYLNAYRVSEAAEDQAGILAYSQMEYNSDLNYFLYEYVQNNEQIVELHDFNTGVQYIKNLVKGTCNLVAIKKSEKVEDLPIDFDDENPGKIKLKSPSKFFGFDETNAQYAGQRRLDGVNTDVWIGTKSSPNNNRNSTYEWHFLSDQFTTTNQASELPVPYLKIQTDYIYQEIDSKVEPVDILSYYSNFRHLEEAGPYDKLLRVCNKNRAQYKHYRFRVPEDKKDLVKKYEPQFKLGVLKMLSEIAKVTYLRITHIEIAFSDYSPYVIFTIYDKSTFYGDVKLPENDVSLFKASLLIEERFANLSSPLQVVLKLPNSEESIKVDIDQGSLIELDDQNRLIIKQNVSDLGYSGASIFFLILFASVNGLMLGILITMMHKFNIVKIPLL